MQDPPEKHIESLGTCLGNVKKKWVVWRERLRAEKPTVFSKIGPQIALYWCTC